MVLDRAGAKKLRMTISFAPNKDDITGEKQLRGSVLLNLTRDSLSCAAAVLEMPEGSPLPPGVAPEDVPLFLDPATGREMTHEYAQERLTTLIRTYDAKIYARMHSLRRGGSSVSRFLGGEAVATAQGGWRSRAKYKYFHLLRDEVEDTSFVMGRASVGPLAHPGAGSMSQARKRTRM